MGLFDRFRKRVTEVAAEVDTDEISVEADTQEAQDALISAQNQPRPNPPSQEPKLAPDEPLSEESEEEWEDLEQLDLEDAAEESSDEWDDFDEEEEINLPVELSRKEKKRIEKSRRIDEKRLSKKRKEMKKRGAVEIARPKGSNVDLSMMRTTTGRQLISVQNAPKGSVKEAEIETESGMKVKVDLGGGVVSEGGESHQSRRST